MAESCNIVGAHFRPPAKAILECLPAGALLSIEPEPDNMFDHNAIKVTVPQTTLAGLPEASLAKLAATLPLFGSDLETVLAAPEHHLGYIPRERAAQLAPALHGEIRQARLTFAASGQPQVTFELPTTTHATGA